LSSNKEAFVLVGTSAQKTYSRCVLDVSLNSALHHGVFEDIEVEELDALNSMGASLRKKQGVFFTPSDLAKLSLSKIDICVDKDIALDPACGSGNLLLEIADRLQVEKSLRSCLLSWNKKLHGLDINPVFINLAKKKIIRLAVSKGAIADLDLCLENAMSLLDNIRVGDFLVEYSRYKGKVNCIVMNPPFCPINTPDDVSWTSGRSNAAALFASYAVDVLPEGGKLLGILPDVLKSGSRYASWRKHIHSQVVTDIFGFGAFEPGVQIDVFVISAVKSLVPQDVIKVEDVGVVLSDRYNVSVGPVVPHRDIFVGVETPYAHAKILPAWETVTDLEERICHSGRKIKTPFVAVRRTSSPKDKYRAVGTIVNCYEDVAVENHIIAISPMDGRIESCVNLLSLLRSQAVNNYINSKIRCRHLTVGVVKGIPLEAIDEHEG